MPPYKDEQFDDGADNRVSRRDRARRINPQARQTHNPPQREEDFPKDFYTDEHPEIPKVRRASLYLDQHPSSARHPITRASKTEKDSTKRVSNSQRLQTQYHDQDKHDYIKEYYTEPKSNNVASQRHRSRVSPAASSQPPRVPKPAHTSQPRNGHRILTKPQPQRYKRQEFAPFPFLPQFIQRQNVLKITGSMIALLLVLIVLSNLLHNVFSQVPAIIVIPGSTNNNPTPTDPHALVVTPVNTDHPAPPVYAQAAYLLDADTFSTSYNHTSSMTDSFMSTKKFISGTGTTLYAYNPFTHLPIMSTTKLMTALLAVEHGNLDQTVTLNGQIADDISHLSPDSSNINLKAGESYTLRDLMYGLLMASGNDAAIAIADTIGGSYANFVAMMNQRAADLGLHDTHFANPHGLQEPNHYSCAHDLAILGLNSLTNPTIRKISGTLNYHIDQNAQHAAHDFFNGNQFIWWYPGVDAGKPGYDAATNFVQVISCIRNGHHLIGVTIHTINWWTDMRDLMNWGFNTYSWISPHDLNNFDHPIPYANLWNNFDSDTKESTIPTTDHGRYYIYTGYSMTGDIENFFDKNGGLTTLGFPTSQPGPVKNNTVSQRFEHGTIQCNTQTRQCQKGT